MKFFFRPKNKNELNRFLKALHFLSAAGALFVFFFTLKTFPVELNIFILSVAILYLIPIFIKSNKFSKFNSIFNAFIIPIWFATAILLFGGYFAQALASVTLIFISYILFRKESKLRLVVIVYQILLFIIPTIYIAFYGPYFGVIDIPFDEIIVYFCCITWLSITFVIYDEQKTKSFTKKLEAKNEDLIQLNTSINEKNHQIEEFTAILYHDLKEPVNNILAFSKDLLKKANELESQLPIEITDNLNFITQSSSRMNQLILTISDYTKIGKERLKKNIDCNKLVREVLDDIAAKVTSTKTEINVGNLPTVYGYATELRMLFQNLILNAIKFKKPDQVAKIRISYFTNDNYYQFQIVDNGIGIPTIQSKKIFDAFIRLNSRQNYEGVGLGLYNAKRIIEMHNGLIWVESKEDNGSTFNFTLEK
ncbi:sensor histidine kinase [Croceivirga thetidis]|uniref:histidine kinase n=1 Tax=Croceivirga thetidis TaxID=2721623 RepID=A0ABX1GL04_9FLAO|nr:ATP-binding protein [Croceivirga thetidis]NKI30541.1 hypothetical protein [Croceivirga thetidis]